MSEKESEIGFKWIIESLKELIDETKSEVKLLREKTHKLHGTMSNIDKVVTDINANLNMTITTAHEHAEKINEISKMHLEFSENMIILRERMSILTEKSKECDDDIHEIKDDLSVIKEEMKDNSRRSKAFWNILKSKEFWFMIVMTNILVFGEQKVFKWLGL